MPGGALSAAVQYGEPPATKNRQGGNTTPFCGGLSARYLPPAGPNRRGDASRTSGGTAEMSDPDRRDTKLGSITLSEDLPMPLYLCRWPNGDVSVLMARNKTDAIIQLDEFDNADYAEISRLKPEHPQYRKKGELFSTWSSSGSRRQVGVSLSFGAKAYAKSEARSWPVAGCWSSTACATPTFRPA